MLFSSAIFLFLFLPLTLLAYYFSPKKIKNYVLLLASLIFFAWGGVSYSIILIVSITVNYFFGLAIEKNRETKKGYRWTFAGVAINILVLALFKYANFFTRNLNEFFGIIHGPSIPETDILLPIGISFYTFHLISYLVDIYKGKSPASKNIFDAGLYVSMFSQLVAGPIIRYSDVWQQLKSRDHSLAKFSSGVERFVIGLAKKVLLANTLAVIADAWFTRSPPTIGALNAWLGILCYTFQIYCDFSGYSDMAIGLGRMFGFDFQENFNFPYSANSIREFWRRWHISLSSFFRDYVFIPLGGSRKGNVKTYLNLFLVFLLTGFWHGASWNFVCWGLYHGFFIILERIGLGKILDKIWKPIGVIYTFSVVMFGWVLFRSPDLTHALSYWKVLFDPAINPAQISWFMSCLNFELVAVFSVAVVGSFGLFTFLKKVLLKMYDQIKSSTLFFELSYHLVSVLFYGGLFLLSVLYLIAGTYNPFIYYRF
jgi:alginate O-acetyltransferase complex protein AlgI